MEVIGAMNALMQASSLAKRAWELSERAKDVELRSCLVDLRSALNDARERTEELREENSRLRQELRQGQETTDLRTGLVPRDGGYYLRQPREGYADGPYCTTCMDTRGELVLMVKKEPPFDVFGYNCGRCMNERRTPTRQNSRPI
jgi:hypothetical protein